MDVDKLNKGNELHNRITVLKDLHERITRTNPTTLTLTKNRIEALGEDLGDFVKKRIAKLEKEFEKLWDSSHYLC